jgi:hypothetical protein
VSDFDCLFVCEFMVHRSAAKKLANQVRIFNDPALLGHTIKQITNLWVLIYNYLFHFNMYFFFKLNNFYHSQIYFTSHGTQTHYDDISHQMNIWGILWLQNIF